MVILLPSATLEGEAALSMAVQFEWNDGCSLSNNGAREGA